MDIPFGSDEAVAISDELLEFISYHAILASSRLAKEKGAYSSYKGSKWDRNLFPIDTLKMLEKERGRKTGINFVSRMDWKKIREHVQHYGMRNSNCMAIAPTATISTIVDTYPSFEPIYKNLYVKSNQTGEFTIINKFLVEDLKKLGIWNEELINRIKYYDGNIQRIAEIPQQLRNKYKEAFEIDESWTIRHAAYRGKWIDQSQSTNIFTTSQSGKTLSNIYMQAWEMGLKTTYYLRTLGATGIEKSTLDINKKYDEPALEVEPGYTAGATMVSAVPACKIADPDCEACQ